MSQGDLFQGTVALLQRAALRDEHWLSAAAGINEAVGTRGHGFTFGRWRSDHDKDFLSACFVFGRMRREDWEHQYVRHYMLRDERAPRLFQHPSGEVVRTGDLLTERERRTSAVYNEMLRDMQAMDGLTVHLDGPAGTRIALALADSLERAGWSSDQVEMIERLLPHVRHSIWVRQALLDARVYGETLAGLLDNTRTCVIQLDRWGRVVEANDVAREIFGRGDALIVTGRFLRAWGQAENAKLQQLLAGALPPFGGQAVGGSMVIRRLCPAKALVVHVNPVGAELRGDRTLCVAAVVLAVNPGSRARVDQDLVASAFGLTPKESQVAAMLAAGSTVQDIAEATHRNEGSVRWLLNQIFRKQGIGRQAELVRRVLSIQGLSGQDVRSDERVSSDENQSIVDGDASQGP